MSTNLNISQNSVEVSSDKDSIAITNNNTGNIVNISQQNTPTVTVSAVGIQGAVGPQGIPGEIAGSLTADNIIQPFTHITSSGNISASGNVLGNFFYSNETAALGFVGGTMYLGNALYLTEIDGTNITLDAPVTASGNISSSGNLNAANITTPGILTVGHLEATTINTLQLTSSIVTSSVIFSSGSNIFGDETSDTHTFIGNITASGNISASGEGNNIFGGPIIINAAANNLNLFEVKDTGQQRNFGVKIDSNQHTDVFIERDSVEKIRFNTYHPSKIDNDGYESIGGLILGNDVGNEDKSGFGLYVSAGPDSGSIYSSEKVFIGVGEATSSNNMLTVGGNISTTSHITASGNISASGDITTQDITSRYIDADRLTLTQHLKLDNPTDIIYFGEPDSDTIALTSPQQQTFAVSLGDDPQDPYVEIGSQGLQLYYGTLDIPSDLKHMGDTNTKLSFATDAITLTAGGIDFITMTEAASDTLVFGNVQTTFEGNITASGNISASGTIVASNLSGSNTGDQDLSNLVTNAQTASFAITSSNVIFGNITSSGNISSSGRVFATHLKLNQDGDGNGIDSSIYFGSTPSLGGKIYDDTNGFVMGYNDTDVLKVGENTIEITNTLKVYGGGADVMIGANAEPGEKLEVVGNISASGEVYGDKINVDGFASLDTNTTVTPTGRLFEDGSLTAIEIGRSNLPTKNISLFGPVTASGNISSSGTVESDGLILTSPNGTRYQIAVANDGTLSASSI